MKPTREQRMAQRQRDREQAYWKLGVELADPLCEYRSFMETLRTHGVTSGELVRIPASLIDFTAWFATTMLDGPGCAGVTDEAALQRDTRFLAALLMHARLSCSTLLLALFYVTRLRGVSVARFARRRRRSRRDSATFANRQCVGEYDEGVTSKGVLAAKTAQHALSAGTPSDTSTGWSVPRLLLASLIVADKYLFDETYDNAQWNMFARACGNDRAHAGLDRTCVNALERQLLHDLDYRVHIRQDVYARFLDQIEAALTFWRLRCWSRGQIPSAKRST
ncbi:hypothetical protein THASP1DRAFT_33520, partial [Thamnocephalis sphaerospora]